MTHRAEPGVNAPWLAIRTRARAEQVVADRLAAQAIETFLPRYLEPVEWSDRVHQTRRPLFPGYLFARLIESQMQAVRRTPGAIQILGEPIAEQQIDSIRIACAATEDLTPCAYREGELVEICSGPFAGCEGIVDTLTKNRLILRVDILRRAVAVTIEPGARIRRKR